MATPAEIREKRATDRAAKVAASLDKEPQKSPENGEETQNPDPHIADLARSLIGLMEDENKGKSLFKRSLQTYTPRPPREIKEVVQESLQEALQLGYDKGHHFEAWFRMPHGSRQDHLERHPHAYRSPCTRCGGELSVIVHGPLKGPTGQILGRDDAGPIPLIHGRAMRYTCMRLRGLKAKSEQNELVARVGAE